MRNSKQLGKQRQKDFASLQGGELSESVVQRALGDVNKRIAAEVNEKTATERQAAKYFKQFKVARDDSDAEAIDGLRKVTEQLAKQKLVTPRRPLLPPDIWGRYTLRFTPPYTGLGTSVVGQVSSVTGNPTITATGVDSIGQLSCSVDTDFAKPSGGTASNLMGVHFKPHFTNATARITFDSDIAFSFYINSIRNKLGFSRAQGLIQLFQFDNTFVQPALRRGAFIGWNEVAQNSLKFDVVSESGPTWFLEAPVSSEHFYFVVISLTCTASGAGWPGSLAGARAIVTVPSITVTITGEPVLTQA